LPGKLDLQLVSSSGCKPCEKVKARLERLREEFPELTVEEIDIGSEEGTAIAVKYRLAALPGILINGRMLLVGDVPEPVLRERVELARRSLALEA
jgi:thiol-disulfide isomerase/thioredoxin